jgi:anti-sigma B factor antagonist
MIDNMVFTNEIGTLEVTELQASLVGGLRELKLKGLLDSNTAMTRGDVLRAFIVGNGGVVLLDLSDLTYLSSAGMRVLLQAARDLYRVDGGLHIAAPRARVMAVLTTAGFVPLNPVYRTLEEAREKLADGMSVGMAV